MPEEGESRQAEIPSKASRFRKAYLKGEPLVVGGAWFLSVQFVQFLLTQAGYKLDPTHWRASAIGLGAIAFLISRAHVFTLAFRIAGINFMYMSRMISKAEYQRIRSVVVKAYLERVAKD
jgi:hypothetical protein